jgi:hypothetical protein
MGNYNEDTNQDFRTLFLIILFSLFVLASPSNSGSNTSSKYSSQNGLVSGNISSHFNAIICSTVSLSNLQKYCEYTFHYTGLNQYLIQNKISDYNRRIAQNFILIKKTRLSIEPFPLKLYSHLPSKKDDDLPVLS